MAPRERERGREEPERGCDRHPGRGRLPPMGGRGRAVRWPECDRAVLEARCSDKAGTSRPDGERPRTNGRHDHARRHCTGRRAAERRERATRGEPEPPGRHRPNSRRPQVGLRSRHRVHRRRLGDVRRRCRWNARVGRWLRRVCRLRGLQTRNGHRVDRQREQRIRLGRGRGRVGARSRGGERRRLGGRRRRGRLRLGDRRRRGVDRDGGRGVRSRRWVGRRGLSGRLGHGHIGGRRHRVRSRLRHGDCRRGRRRVRRR